MLGLDVGSAASQLCYLRQLLEALVSLLVKTGAVMPISPLVVRVTSYDHLGILLKCGFCFITPAICPEILHL